jgi:hypothetical protein
MDMSTIITRLYANRAQADAVAAALHEAGFKASEVAVYGHHAPAQASAPAESAPIALAPAEPAMIEHDGDAPVSETDTGAGLPAVAESRAVTVVDTGGIDEAALAKDLRMAGMEKSAVAACVPKIAAGNGLVVVSAPYKRPPAARAVLDAHDPLDAGFETYVKANPAPDRVIRAHQYRAKLLTRGEKVMSGKNFPAILRTKASRSGRNANTIITRDENRKRPIIRGKSGAFSSAMKMPILIKYTPSKRRSGTPITSRLGFPILTTRRR